ncbi:hypothetical protein C0991_009371, partial [Blastosporella zonata]
MGRCLRSIGHAVTCCGCGNGKDILLYQRFARLSMLAGIIRLGYYTTYLRISAGIFCVSMIILVAQLLWCAVGSGVAIAEVISMDYWLAQYLYVSDECLAADAFADVVLVCAPLLILRDLNSKADRLRLSVSFAVGGLTTIFSIVHAYYVIKGDISQLLVGIIE